jgi:hypothetical protein
MTILVGDKLEDAIAARPNVKVTKEYIDRRIVRAIFTKLPESTITICQIHLDNGFVVTGESACSHPGNYDQTVGESIAYQNAYEKLWLLFGFLLKECLYKTSGADNLLSQFT